MPSMSSPPMMSAVILELQDRSKRILETGDQDFFIGPIPAVGCPTLELGLVVVEHDANLPIQIPPDPDAVVGRFGRLRCRVGKPYCGATKVGIAVYREFAYP